MWSENAYTIKTRIKKKKQMKKENNKKKLTLERWMGGGGFLTKRYKGTVFKGVTRTAS